MKSGSYLKNAAVLSLGSFAAKAIGALYRVPLAMILGGYGMGLYQMAYPLFCVLITLSSAGVPSAFSRLLAGEIAAGSDGRDTLFTALRLFAALGALGTLGMFLLAPVMSNLQGEKALLPCYLVLAPAVFLETGIAVLRGYFQGKNDMAPTACSEICEQLFKAGLGLVPALCFRADPARAALCALGAVTLSELCALLYLLRRLAGEPRIPRLKGRKTSPSSVFLSALPVMLSAAILPLSRMLDSVVLVRLLEGTGNAVSLYGLFAGGALTLVGVPASICHGLASASVPSVAAATARKDEEGAKKHALSALLYTLALAVPSVPALLLFSKPAARLLFPSLAEEEFSVLVRLIRISSISAATLAGLNTLSSCLTGMGKANCAASSVLLGVLVKLALQILLVPLPKFSVLGAAIAENACYPVAFFLDLFYTVKKNKEKQRDHDRKFGDGTGRLDGAGTACGQSGGRGACTHGADALARNA